MKNPVTEQEKLIAVLCLIADNDKQFSPELRKVVMPVVNEILKRMVDESVNELVSKGELPKPTNWK